MDEAIEMARRIGDPITIASALTAAESALHAPHTARERLANAGEIVALATAAGDRERLFDGHEHAFWASWELGDPERRARELAAMTRVAEDLRQPAQLWMLAAAHATLALAQGRFARGAGADRARRARSVSAVLAWNAAAARTLQRFLLCREQGGLDGLPGRGRATRSDAFPSPLVHGSVLAHGLARLGRPRRRRRSCASSRATTCRTGTSTSSGWSASACSRRPARSLDDLAPAAALYDLLLPLRGAQRGRRPRAGAGLHRPHARRPGDALERFEDAERHFEHGAAHERAHGRAAVARAHAASSTPACCAAVTARATRAGAGAPRAGAQATYRELGMEEHL